MVTRAHLSLSVFYVEGDHVTKLQCASTLRVIVCGLGEPLGDLLLQQRVALQGSCAPKRSSMAGPCLRRMRCGSLLRSTALLVCVLCTENGSVHSWQPPSVAFALRQGHRVSMEDYATSFDVVLHGLGETNRTFLRILSIFDGHEVRIELSLLEIIRNPPIICVCGAPVMRLIVPGLLVAGAHGCGSWCKQVRYTQ